MNTEADNGRLTPSEEKDLISRAQRGCQTSARELIAAHQDRLHVTLQYQSDSFSGRILDVHPRDGLLLQLDNGGRRLFDPIYTSRIA